MSTPDEPPQLTRKLLRELRNTAATQIITETPAPTEAPVAAPLPRAAEPITLPDPPEPIEAEPPVSEAPPALTRREVRQRERLRTASVPVITADVLAASVPEDAVVSEQKLEDAEFTTDEARSDGEQVVVDAEIVSEPDATDAEVAVADEEWSPPAERTAVPDVAEPVEADVAEADEADIAEANEVDAPPRDVADPVPAVTPQAAAEDAAERRVIAADLGAELLVAQAAEVEVPASFDQLLTRGSAATGALSMPNALILSQTPDGGSLVSPVTATGEVLITGTFSLPDRYGSTGTVPGSADGKEVDAVLVDGELPAASSPTPIAASAAISTIKSADEIIRPPAPEKGSRLMVVLAITAGVLAVALAGVLILAITTGLFS